MAKTIRMVIDVTIEDWLADCSDQDERDWLFDEVLKKGLVLHSNEIGDTVSSSIEVISAEEKKEE